MAAILEARSPEQEPKTAEQLHEACLRKILPLELPCLFRRHHLNREIIMGLIGLRGDGKSGSGACISLLDFMVEGKPVWSNMSIRVNIGIDDETAQKYGLKKGGTVKLESIPLDKTALLKLDEQYRGGLLFIDEINVQFANARRAMSNTNVDFNTVCQEIRKFETSLIYTVINEMFVDSQLRELTDVFIKSEDTAFTAENLEARKAPGVDFKWSIYPLSGYLVGRERSYYVTGKPMPPVFFHFEIFRGIYDDKEFQKKGVYTSSAKDGIKQTIVVAESDEGREVENKWGWLAEKAQYLRESGIEQLTATELWHFLDIIGHGYTPIQMGPILPAFGIKKWKQGGLGQWVYKVEMFNLSENEATRRPG